MHGTIFDMMIYVRLQSKNVPISSPWKRTTWTWSFSYWKFQSVTMFTVLYSDKTKCNFFYVPSPKKMFMLFTPYIKRNLVLLTKKSSHSQFSHCGVCILVEGPASPFRDPKTGSHMWVYSCGRPNWTSSSPSRGSLPAVDETTSGPSALVACHAHTRNTRSCVVLPLPRSTLLCAKRCLEESGSRVVLK